MKTLVTFTIAMLLLGSESLAQESPEVLVGIWKLDMSPQNPDDDNFAMMHIKKVKDGKMSGVFYRDGVKMKNGNVNNSTGTIYGALISGDNSGSYNTSFYYEGGKLYGTTLAVQRDFLSVWVAIKEL